MNWPVINLLGQREDQSMKMAVHLLPNSMPLTIHLAALLLLLLCFPISCLGTQYDLCLSENTCGDFQLSYPFGTNNGGCGDPEFQLKCGPDDQSGHFLLTIDKHEYRILKPFLLGNNSTNTMTIVHDHYWGIKCSLYSNYSSFWSPASNFRILPGTYTNLSIWGYCDRSTGRNYTSAWHNFTFCGDIWYYSLVPEAAPFCQKYLQLPVNKNLSLQRITNDTIVVQGFEVTWHVDRNRELRCEDCQKSKGVCGYNISEPTAFLCYCPDGTTNSDKCPENGHEKKTGILIGCSFGGVALAAIAVLLIVYYRKRRKPPSGSSNSKVEKFLKEHACEMPMPTRYSHSHLKKITNNFAEKLGEGGFGVVYKGMLRNGGLVAVKLLDRHRHTETQFMNEVATIGRVHHVNLVRLLGYCFENPISALVYEYMPNGSLDKILFEEGQVLKWEQLYSIALGAARGIAYLHHDCDKRIIHFDIKPHNILLDADFTPKVSDFGLAKLCGKGDDHISMTAWRGTPGYVAPELCHSDAGPVTDKSDVYSFGMLSLEIVGGRKNTELHANRSSQFYFPEWAFKLIESDELGMRLRGGEMECADEEKARRLTKVGLWCIQYNSSDRPCMMRVVQMLEGDENDVTNPPLPINSLPSPEKTPPSSSGIFSSIEVTL